MRCAGSGGKLSTTQSEDPEERVPHPRFYNAHSSGIECIEIIEHLPSNLAAAVKYLWRCGLKSTEVPLRDLQKARWYTERESERVDLYELDGEETPKTDVVWRSLAHKVIRASDPKSVLADYLQELLDGHFSEMVAVIDYAIEQWGKKTT